MEQALAAVLAEARRGAETSELRQLVHLLLTTPSPWGHERAAAEAVAEWMVRSGSAARVRIDGITDERANVFVEAGQSGRHLLVCSHLDTSLTGETEADQALTGRRDELGDPIVDGDVLIGPGLAVARGPAAAATAGFLSAVAALDRAGLPHHSSLLLAAGGTHRRPRSSLAASSSSPPPPRFGIGVRHALAHGDRPTAVLMAKAGPPAVLHEEPGSAYVDIELRGSLIPAMLRTDKDQGLLGNLPVVLEAIEEWRNTFVTRPAVGQIGREAAVGAVVAGSPEKCDLLPAVARISVYVVLGHGDAGPAVAADLERAIAASLPTDGSVRVSAILGPWDPAGRTAADAPVVRATKAATGLDTSIQGWRGSTDGVVFRATGIDTARWGPTITADPVDPRRDRVELDVLTDAARKYGEVVVRYACS